MWAKAKNLNVLAGNKGFGRFLSVASRRYTQATIVQPDPFALASKMSGKTHFYNGSYQASKSGATFDVLNPATGKVITQASRGDAADVDAAVTSASGAQKQWAKMSARQRGALVAECGNLISKNVEELARLVALETGKAIRTESRVEASVLADVFKFYGGLGSELKGETVPFNPDMLNFTLREPIGVVGAIIPWNAPLLLMALKIAPALVAGNTVVVKSAESAPLTVARIIELMSSLLPAGVVNMVSGYGKEVGTELVRHKKVGKVTFTGSVQTGRTIYTEAGAKLMPVTLELGGKSPMIVADDADIDKAVAGAIGGMRFTRQGQSCTAASRIFVHGKVHDEFVEKLTRAVNTMKMGDPLLEETDIGAVISRAQLDKIKRYIELGKQHPGAVAHECCQLPTDPALRDGFFVRPVVFTGLPNKHQVCQEEIFGPVTAVLPWTNFDRVIEEANDTEFGLSATIWTRNLNLSMQAIKRLEAGIVQVNQNIVVQPGVSFGGYKTSGLGKEASLEAMLEHFTNKKTVIINTAPVQ